MKVDGSKVRIALIAVIIGVLLGAYIGYALTPTTTFTISPGVYPGAPDYTIWREGSNYFAKNKYGEIEFSGTNASQVIQSAINALTNGGKIFIHQGVYEINTPIILKEHITIVGEGGIKSNSGKGTTVLSATQSIDSVFKTSPEEDTLIAHISLLYLRIVCNDLVETAINLTNVDSTEISWVAIRGATSKGIHLGFYGTIPPSGGTIPGGMTIQHCRFYDTNAIEINIEYNTQDWILFNWFAGGNPKTAIRIFDSNKIKIRGNEINTPTEHGILITDDDNPSSHNIQVAGNWINPGTNCYPIKVNLTSPSVYSDITVTDNLITDDGLGLSLDNCVIVDGTDFNGKPLRNSGTATISSGTSVTFNHGLAGTPTLVLCSFNNTGYGEWKWSATSTQITITVTNSGTYEVYWYAEYKP